MEMECDGATLQLPHHTAAANTPNTLVIDQVSHLTTWGWGTYNKSKISISKYFMSMWHTFNCHIWVPNVNIIKDLHTVYSKAAHVLHAPGDHCDRCGRSSQRIYNCQSCLQSGSLLSCLAPNTENYHISPLLGCIETPRPRHPGPHSTLSTGSQHT